MSATQIVGKTVGTMLYIASAVFLLFFVWRNADWSVATMLTWIAIGGLVRALAGK